MKRVFVLIAALILMLSLVGNVFAEGTSDTGRWEVTVGKATKDGVSLDSMFPKVIFIHEGETIKFTNGSLGTPHTVTFPAGLTEETVPEDFNPFAPNVPSGSSYDGKSMLNSGMLLPGDSYSVTFTGSGAFNYLCILHPMMTGVVVVLPKGVPSIPKELQIAGIQMDTDDLIRQADALLHSNHQADAAKNQDGTVTYKVGLGAGHNGFTLNKMLPETIFISEGDSVEWLNENQYEPHFVTFNKPADLEFFTETGDFAEEFMVPAGGDSFDGTGFTNSGIIEAQEKYKLKFTKAGTYPYECYLHTGDRMRGTVVVAPKDAIKVVVNGKPLLYNYKLPHLKNNHVYVAIVPFAEALGGTAVWDAKLNAVIVNIGKTYELPNQLKDTPGLKVSVNGKQLEYGLNPAPYSIDGRSYAPIQEVVSLLGGSYSWDELTQTFSATVK